jgi:hypothetical protein
MDDELRRAERHAADGDARASRALETQRARSGVPVCHPDHERRTERVCRHLLDRPDWPEDVDSFTRRYTGVGVASHLLCAACAKSEPDLADSCAACVEAIERSGYEEPHLGEPQVLERPSALAFEHETVGLGALVGGRVLAIEPLEAAPGNAWIALDERGRLVSVDLAARSVLGMSDPIPLEPVAREQPVELHVSPRGDLVAIVNPLAHDGLVADARTGAVLMRLRRELGNPYIRVTPFALSFVERGGATFLLHASRAAICAVSEPRSGRLLGEFPAENPTYRLTRAFVPSPGHEWVADDGWNWGPECDFRLWRTEELVDGPRRALGVYDGQVPPFGKYRRGIWPLGGVVWIGARTLALSGRGRDQDDDLVPAAVIHDVVEGRELRWFAGPSGTFFFERHLVSASREGTSVWDVATGERLLRAPDLRPLRHHRNAHVFLSLEGENARLSRLTGA